MKVLNLGSLNLDYVYQVNHIVQPGETISGNEMKVFAGGKGLNQSVALSKAGVMVYHGGIIGEDGKLFLEEFRKYGIDTRYIEKVKGKSGHAIIQVDKGGQNSILLFGGTNRIFTTTYIDNTLKDFTKGDMLLLQNEINLLPYIINKAYEKGMVIALNPSPYNEVIESCDLTKVSIFLLNEIEGEQITKEKEPEKILKKLMGMYPFSKIVLTLGKAGVLYGQGKSTYFQESFSVKAVDTTAAGDTFTGYFIAGIIANKSIPHILRMSAKASAITVTRNGAAKSIPTKDEVINLDVYED